MRHLFSGLVVVVLLILFWVLFLDLVRGRTKL